MDANQEMMAKVDTQLKKMKACLGKTDATVETFWSAEEMAWRPASSRKVPWSAEEKDPGHWWS